MACGQQYGTYRHIGAGRARATPTGWARCGGAGGGAAARACSRRLFQPNQHAVRDHHRVLHAHRVQSHVGGGQVRLGRRPPQCRAAGPPCRSLGVSPPTPLSPDGRYEYHWSDGVQFKKPVRVSAPEYVDYLMTWVSQQLDDEAIFPSRIGVCTRRGAVQGARDELTSWRTPLRAAGSTLACRNRTAPPPTGVPFPKNFQTTVKLIFKRLFRVYAHIYYSHFQKVVALNEEAHLNTSFKVRTLDRA